MPQWAKIDLRQIIHFVYIHVCMYYLICTFQRCECIVAHKACECAYSKRFPIVWLKRSNHNFSIGRLLIVISCLYYKLKVLTTMGKRYDQSGKHQREEIIVVSSCLMICFFGKVTSKKIRSQYSLESAVRKVSCRHQLTATVLGYVEQCGDSKVCNNRILRLSEGLQLRNGSFKSLP